MYTIQWASRTRSDFKRLRDFLKEKNSLAANRIRPVIEKSIQAIQDNPKLGTSLDDTLGRRVWRVPFGSGEYIIYYIPDHDAKIIRILRIWHSREDR